MRKSSTTVQTTDPHTARITELVCKHLEIEPDEISETDLFVADHGSDSLSLIDLLAALEKEFKVTIDQDKLPMMVNISSVRQVLAELAGW
jgi:acyl carrier protein